VRVMVRAADLRRADELLAAVDTQPHAEPPEDD
jgi:hypothetical protein